MFLFDPLRSSTGISSADLSFTTAYGAAVWVLDVAKVDPPRHLVGLAFCKAGMTVLMFPCSLRLFRVLERASSYLRTPARRRKGTWCFPVFNASSISMNRRFSLTRQRRSKLI